MTVTTIVSVSTFKEFIEPISALVDECKLHAGESGFEVKAVDPANVGVVHATLDAGGFESYESDGVLLGIDLSDIEDVISFADSGDLLYIDYLESTRKLQLRVGGLTYTGALIDPESIRQEPEIPDIDLPGEFVLEGEDLDRYVKASDMVSDHIVFGYDLDSDKLYSDAEGDTNDTQFELGVSDELIDGQCSESVRSRFSLDYLKDISKPIKASAEVTMDLGSEFPVRLHNNIAEGHGQITNQLAPRIAGDE